MLPDFLNYLSVDQADAIAHIQISQKFVVVREVTLFINPVRGINWSVSDGLRRYGKHEGFDRLCGLKIVVLDDAEPFWHEIVPLRALRVCSGNRPVPIIFRSSKGGEISS